MAFFFFPKSMSQPMMSSPGKAKMVELWHRSQLSFYSKRCFKFPCISLKPMRFSETWAFLVLRVTSCCALSLGVLSQMDEACEPLTPRILSEAYCFLSMINVDVACAPCFIAPAISWVAPVACSKSVCLMSSLNSPKLLSPSTCKISDG